MGKILCFVPEQYADFEVVLALHLLKDVGKREIVTVGYSPDPVVSYSGVKTLPDCTLEEAAALGDAEAFLMPGGPIRERSERLVSFIRTMDERQILLAAICFGRSTWPAQARWMPAAIPPPARLRISGGWVSRIPFRAGITRMSASCRTAA